MRDALSRGIEDFRANPTHLVVLCLIYPIAGLLLGRAASGYDALPLIYPLVAGFALFGPVAAVGLYELSRQRERGIPVTWRNAFDVFHSPQIGAIALLGAMLTAIFVIWLMAAQAIYELVMPASQDGSVQQFVNAVLTTPEGWTLIVVGTAVGFVFAVVVLLLGSFSFPMLVDTSLGETTGEQASVAVHTSVRAVLANIVPMAVWGLIVAIGMAIGAVTLLVGFAVVMPVLGHATWHLYRKVIVI